MAKYPATDRAAQSGLMRQPLAMSSNSTTITPPVGMNYPQTVSMMPSANIDYEAQNAKARAIGEAVGNIRKTYDIKHKRVERLRCVSAAFKEARHIELNQDCQKVIDGINHMSGLDKQEGINRQVYYPQPGSAANVWTAKIGSY